jgi:hypothetical protein
MRLHQVWQPALAEEPEDNEPDRSRKQETSGTPRGPALHDDSGLEPDQSDLATRIMLRPHDPDTGEEIKRQEVVTLQICGSGGLRR